MDATTTTSIITSVVGDVGDVLAGSLPLVLGLLGIIIGLVYVWKFVKRNIGGTKG